MVYGCEKTPRRGDRRGACAGKPGYAAARHCRELWDAGLEKARWDSFGVCQMWMGLSRKVFGGNGVGLGLCGLGCGFRDR